jgi:hypothetical protein
MTTLSSYSPSTNYYLNRVGQVFGCHRESDKTTASTPGTGNKILSGSAISTAASR